MGYKIQTEKRNSNKLQILKKLTNITNITKSRKITFTVTD